VTSFALKVILGEPAIDHISNALLQDIILFNRILWKLADKPIPSSNDEIKEIVDKVLDLFRNGKTYEMAGLKDVPRPYMKSTGRFFRKNGETWNILEDDEVRRRLSELILEAFKVDDLGSMTETPYKDLMVWISKFKEKDANDDDAKESAFVPENRDVVLLRCADAGNEKMYEQQGGNRCMFSLASQIVTTSSNTSAKRVEAALSILKGLDDMETDMGQDQSQTTTKYCRFLLRTQREDTMLVNWKTLDPIKAAEFAVVFAFEVFLEKCIDVPSLDESIYAIEVDTAGPSTIPIVEPTDADVLFGRGGMTNSHPGTIDFFGGNFESKRTIYSHPRLSSWKGNRRFRDIIALHRPDYIRAIKLDKPNVARNIVRAIRYGDPPGRFLKKADDGNWYDVGDRTAAEKTSQGLRERTNAEKRQRSALREALRIRKQDMAEDDESPSNKKIKSDTEIDLSVALSPALNYLGSTLPVPLSLNMKPPEVKTVKRKQAIGDDGNATDQDELNTEGLPPNAVDEEGNILVTDYDILCGRGGLTNHHKGNKRFRDIVALHRPDYVRAPKIQKPSVARVIVRAIRNGDPPGRFLRKDEKTGKWVDIGDKKAAEKTSQALREKTNEEREKGKANPPLGSGILLPAATFIPTEAYTDISETVPAANLVVERQAEEDVTNEVVKECAVEGRVEENDQDLRENETGVSV
jgi:hypothetical protein